RTVCPYTALFRSAAVALFRRTQTRHGVRSLRLEPVLLAVLRRVLADDLLGRHPIAVDVALIDEIAVVGGQRRDGHEVRILRGQVHLRSQYFAHVRLVRLEDERALEPGRRQNLDGIALLDVADE